MVEIKKMGSSKVADRADHGQSVGSKVCEGDTTRHGGFAHCGREENRLKMCGRVDMTSVRYLTLRVRDTFWP